MTKFSVGPTGNLIQGHVLDASKSALDRQLRDHDRQLYIRWTTDRAGFGSWEVRRRPNTKAIKEVVKYEGTSICVVDYVEQDLVANVLYTPRLYAGLLGKIKAMDTTYTNQHYWAEQLESEEASRRERLMAQAQEAKMHAAREHRQEIQDFRDAVNQGLNPAAIADYWDRKVGS